MSPSCLPMRGAPGIASDTRHASCLTSDSGAFEDYRGNEGTILHSPQTMKLRYAAMLKLVLVAAVLVLAETVAEDSFNNDSIIRRIHRGPCDVQPAETARPEIRRCELRCLHR